MTRVMAAILGAGGDTMKSGRTRNLPGGRLQKKRGIDTLVYPPLYVRTSRFRRYDVDVRECRWLVFGQNGPDHRKKLPALCANMWSYLRYASAGLRTIASPVSNWSRSAT